MTVAIMGGYSHTADEVELIGIEKQTGYSPRNKRLTETRTFHLKGEIVTSPSFTQAQMVSKITEIENAYRDDYRDFRFTLDDGTLVHSLLNSSDCVSGVKVIRRPYFPKSEDGEIAVARTFAVVLQATYDAPESDLVSWRESVSIEGDGSALIQVVMEPAGVQTAGGIFGVQLYPRTPQYYTQVGEAVGYLDYPSAPAPVNPEGLYGFTKRITYESGRQVGNGLRFFTTRWHYRMVRDIGAFGSFDPRPTSQ